MPWPLDHGDWGSQPWSRMVWPQPYAPSPWRQAPKPAPNWCCLNFKPQGLFRDVVAQTSLFPEPQSSSLSSNPWSPKPRAKMVWPQHELGQSGTISTSPRALPTDAELMLHVFCTVRAPFPPFFIMNSQPDACLSSGTVAPSFSHDGAWRLASAIRTSTRSNQISGSQSILIKECALIYSIWTKSFAPPHIRRSLRQLPSLPRGRRWVSGASEASGRRWASGASEDLRHLAWAPV